MKNNERTQKTTEVKCETAIIKEVRRGTMEIGWFQYLTHSCTTMGPVFSPSWETQEYF